MVPFCDYSIVRFGKCINNAAAIIPTASHLHRWVYDIDSLHILQLYIPSTIKLYITVTKNELRSGKND